MNEVKKFHFLIEKKNLEENLFSYPECWSCKNESEIIFEKICKHFNEITDFCSTLWYLQESCTENIFEQIKGINSYTLFIDDGWIVDKIKIKFINEIVEW